MPFNVVPAAPAAKPRLDPHKVEMRVTKAPRGAYLKLTIGSGIVARLGISEEMQGQVAVGTGADEGRYRVVFGKPPLKAGRKVRFTAKGMASITMGPPPAAWPNGLTDALCVFTVKSNAREPEGPVIVVDVPRLDRGAKQ